MKVARALVNALRHLGMPKAADGCVALAHAPTDLSTLSAGVRLIDLVPAVSRPAQCGKDCIVAPHLDAARRRFRHDRLTTFLAYGLGRRALQGALRDGDRSRLRALLEADLARLHACHGGCERRPTHTLQAVECALRSLEVGRADGVRDVFKSLREGAPPHDS